MKSIREFKNMSEDEQREEAKKLAGKAFVRIVWMQALKWTLIFFLRWLLKKYLESKTEMN